MKDRQSDCKSVIEWLNPRYHGQGEVRKAKLRRKNLEADSVKVFLIDATFTDFEGFSESYDIFLFP